uniref:LRRCT domain-containing protein n=2 Tax=Tetranychus urticae TaxID=32264 RepID=T1KN92_TETUR
MVINWLKLIALIASAICFGYVSSQNSLCPLLLSSVCQCDVKNFITNCTGSNITDLAWLHDIPIETKTLVLSGNDIPRLPKDVFGFRRKEPKPLEYLDLSNNKIQLINGKSFRGFSLVKKLILNNNQILITGDNYPKGLFKGFHELTELHLASSFADTSNPQFMPNLISLLKEGNLTNLNILNLESNGITNFPDETAFCTLPSLQKLFLAGNSLDQVRVNFTCTPKLRTLDLSHNLVKHLDNISTSFIDDLPRSFHINLTGNAFACDCRMDHFLSWIKRTPLFVMGKDNYICLSGYPEVNVHRRLIQLLPDDLECDPAWNKSSTFSFYPHIILAILTVTVVLLLALVLYQVRSQIMDFFLSTLSSSKNKRYSALRKDEKTELNSERRVIEISV